MKTNTAFAKRIKITKNGKLLGRKEGQDHFNARESRQKQISSKHGKKNMGFLKKYRSVRKIIRAN